MIVRYRGVVNTHGKTRSGGCSSCGTSGLGKTELSLINPFSYFYEAKQYTFYIGQELYVPEELGEVLLRKYSYVNGSKLNAFEEVL